MHTFIAFFLLQRSVRGIPALNLPDVCTASPERNKAFCSEHCQVLNRDAPNVPTGLKDFLKFCGASEGLYTEIILLRIAKSAYLEHVNEH